MFRLVLISCVLVTAAAAGAQDFDSKLRIRLDPPPERSFVLDLAGLLNPDDARRARQICDRLLAERATPIVVVTVKRLSSHGPALPIEIFAHLLFDQWKVGHQELNTGILLLVSRGDRRARIQLGAGWRRQQDATCRRIMDGHIIPHFKRDHYSAGILAGVTALDQMARGKEVPPRRKTPVAWGSLFLVGLFLVGLVAAIVHCINHVGSRGSGVSGDHGYHPGLYGAGYGSGGSFGGGSFGGGSFGGGFSGGGGASGSW